MPGRVSEALKLYLDEEARRSLRLLVGKCAQHGKIVSAAGYGLTSTPATLANGQRDTYGMGLETGTVDGHQSNTTVEPTAPSH